MSDEAPKVKAPTLFRNYISFTGAVNVAASLASIFGLRYWIASSSTDYAEFTEPSQANNVRGATSNEWPETHWSAVKLH